MTRHGTAGFYRVWRSHPLPTGWPAEREIPASRALSAPPSSPRTRPDREASDRSVMAPGEVAEWSNAPHSKFGCSHIRACPLVWSSLDLSTKLGRTVSRVLLGIAPCYRVR